MFFNMASSYMAAAPQTRIETNPKFFSGPPPPPSGIALVSAVEISLALGIGL